MVELVTPYLHIECGEGKIEFGDATFQANDDAPVLHALFIGNEGQGLGVERDRFQAAKDGETLAMITFANMESLGAIERAIARVRVNMEADPSLRPALTDADAAADLAGTPRPDHPTVAA